MNDMTKMKVMSLLPCEVSTSFISKLLQLRKGYKRGNDTSVAVDYYFEKL